MKETSRGRLEVMVRFEGKVTNLKEVLLKIEDEQATVKEVLIPLEREERSSLESRNLADVVEIGDYVNYPVEYENVEVLGLKSSLKGWRVISKNIDLDGNPSEGTVNLVSAGVPLTFWHRSGKEWKSVSSLTTDFLLPNFVQHGSRKVGYVKNGFNSNKFSKVFDNRYTKVVNDSLAIRAMKEIDWKIYRQARNRISKNLVFIEDETNSCCIPYWLASIDFSYSLRFVFNAGRVNCFSNEEYGVRPIVSLKFDVLTDGKDETGAWNIRI